MLIVDTNVISELMRPAPTGSVAQWFEQQPLEQLAITAVTVGEILYGLDLLPNVRRKADLSSRFATVLQRAFSGYVLAFDDAAAAIYARIRGDRNRAGHPISINDAMIAAIARTRVGPSSPATWLISRIAALLSSIRGRSQVGSNDHDTKTAR